MTFPKHPPRFLFLIPLSLLIVQVIGAADANPAFAAQRLRLRVDQNTLRSGASTKVYVEFLDREYRQVHNDRTRVIEFQIASAGAPTGSGSFAPARITVNAGAPYGETTFASAGPGRLFIVAASAGMDAGQVLVFVTRASQGFLSQFFGIFETVAHAQDGLEILAKDQLPVVANNKSSAILYVALSEPPTSPVTVRVTTSPAAKVKYGDTEAFAFMEVKLDQNKAVSDAIHIISHNPGRVAIKASVFPRGDNDMAEVSFIPRVPTKIAFDCPGTIKSTQGYIPISLRLLDGDNVSLETDRERHIALSSADDNGVVQFESDSLVMSPGQDTVQAKFRLQALPASNELRLLATEKNDSAIKHGEFSIQVQSPVQKVLVSGPTTMSRGRKEVKYTIRLADKDGKPVVADWKRKISLSVDRGRLDVPATFIEKGQDSAVVTYYSPNTSGKFKLTADGHGLESGTIEVNVITPEFWLILFALLGALMGGIARQLHKDSKFRNIRPRWIGDDLELGVIGRLVCCLIGGLFLYWIVKLGLSQALGLPVLPATLDLGSKSAAVVLGGLGGFGGTLVLQKSAERLFGEKVDPASPQAPPPQAPPQLPA